MRRFIECLLPITACNLKCSYCYIIQGNRRTNKKATFQYSPEHIGKALSKERLGGISLISITGSGETFIPQELPAITYEILKQGHFVNITTNGTLTSKIQKFLAITEKYHDHLHISFSFHYVELKEKGLLKTFFDNIKMVRNAGCSFLLQINLSDDYLKYWEEIKKISLENCGAYPQVALTRKEKNNTYEIHSHLTTKAYIKTGEEMQSPLFDFTCKNFMVKRNEYCYAGYWSGKLDLGTGILTGCYGNGIKQNIFKDLNKRIQWCPIGKHCNFQYCFNSSHFISQGIIPELEPLPSYGELRNREDANWYTTEMKQFLYQKFQDTNLLLNSKQKQYYNLKYFIYQYTRISSWKQLIKKFLKRISFHS
ncbi:radical SAM protein [Bacteroides clarus]|uniref:radical SAM protein n=1 Tax=Bacteroides clarus TaxID=626929 RepID=UPI00266673EF|nr:radical SAM protein [Bacteroides clarus]